MSVQIGSPLASSTSPGIVSTTAQTFSGDKTFLGEVTAPVSSSTVISTGSTTSITLADRFAEVVNVMDFGAIGDGVTDDTVAIQAAVDHALSLTPHGSVFLPKKHLVTASIIINRGVDTTTDKFLIFGNGSGSGLYTTNTGTTFTMFDSTISGTTDPVSEGVCFSNVHFSGSSTSVTTRVISSKFLRVGFINCYFYQIYCLYSTIYVQTWYFQDCRMVGCMGDGTTPGQAFFFDSTGGGFDVSFSECTIEHNGYFFRSEGPIIGSNGYRFLNNLFEGNGGSSIVITGCSGLLVSGNYFEGNGDNDIHITNTNTNPTASFIGNLFGTTGSNTQVLIEVADNIYSEGNLSGASASALMYEGVANVTNFVSIGDYSIGTLFDSTPSGSFNQNLSLNGVVKLPTLTASKALALDGSKNITTFTYVPASPGDIPETSFSVANNQSTPANVTGLVFSNAVVRSFEALVSIYIDATSDLFEVYTLRGIQRGSDWDMSQTCNGDDSLIVFSITSGGQVQYTSGNYTGFSSGTIKFRAITTGL